MGMIEQSLGSLASNIAGASRVFHQHRLDFCCGGKQSLGNAAAEKGLDVASIVAQLEALGQTPSNETDWRGAGNVELIQHILARFHERHREQLPELIRLARRVEYVHGDKSDCPNGLADHLTAMQQELVSHMEKEEQVLFPMLASGVMPSSPIAMMRFEHDQHGEALAKLEALTNNITPPANACNTWRALYVGLAAFREDLMQHIHLENNILFEGLAAKKTGTCGCGGGNGAGGCA